MKHRILFIFIVIVTGSAAYSQQTALITQYMYTQMGYNPGYAGSNEGICATGLVRQMWLGFSGGAPQTFLITVDSPLKVLHGGVGGSIMQDQLGYFSTTQVKLDYAYRMDLGAGMLGIGAEFILQNSKMDMSKLADNAIDPSDPLLTGNDKSSDMVLDCSLGAYYKVPDKYYVGLSALQLLQTKQKKNFYKLRRTYVANGGYNWLVPNHPGYELQPSAILMFDGAAWQTTVNAILVYNKKISGGLGFRYQDGVASVPLIFGMVLKNFRIGISYDIGTSGSGFNNGGSLEIMLNYCFKIETEKFRKSYKNTRFL